MRTTLDIDGSVLEELRRRSARERKSMGQVASELLASALAEHNRDDAAQTFTWRSEKLGTPRVDLGDKEAVRRALEDQR